MAVQPSVRYKHSEWTFSVGSLEFHLVVDNFEARLVIFPLVSLFCFQNSFFCSIRIHILIFQKVEAVFSGNKPYSAAKHMQLPAVHVLTITESFCLRTHAAPVVNW